METLVLDIRLADGQGSTWLGEGRLTTFDADALITLGRAALGGDPDAVKRAGHALWAALGGEALRDPLAALPPAPDGMIGLRLHGDALQALPWELAYRGGHDDDFLALDYLVVRLVAGGRPPAPPPPGAPWRLVVQGSDPLVYEWRDAATGERRVQYQRPLRVVRELNGLRRSIVEATPPVPFRWQRIAPTAAALTGLATGGEPLIFHYTGHGTIEKGQPSLCLDDGTGRMKSAAALSLMRALRGHAHLAFLNACRTADEAEPAANLALALVRGGIPIVVGNRTVVEDDKAATLAFPFYGQVANGAHPAEALWRARLVLHEAHATDPVAWSLPLLFMAEGYAWPRIERPATPLAPIGGPPLNLAALQAPEEIVGRADELVELATAFVLDGARAVTIRGPGGMGKTALSKALAERLRFHFRDGIHALTLILPGGAALSAAAVRAMVARLLHEADFLPAPVAEFEKLPIEEQEATLVRAVGGRELLLIFDNYETVLQRIGREGAEEDEADGDEGAPSLVALLTAHFDVGEMTLLAHEVAGLAPDEVEGDRRDERAVALVEALERRGKLAALLPLLEQKRPGKPWAAALATARAGLPAPTGSARAEAEAVQRLARRLKEGGARLLFTTRQSPVGFEDRYYPPDSDEQLGGLRRRDAVRLFRMLTRAHGHHYSEGFPARVAEAVGDSPLYLELAAARWNGSQQSEAAFLGAIAEALLAAQQEGVPENRQQATANLLLSLDPLPAEWRAQFLALTLIANPTISPLHAAVLWGWEDETRWFTEQAHERLEALAERSLLRVVGRDGERNRAEGYTFQPLLAQVARTLAPEEALAAPRERYATWAASVVNQAFGEGGISYSPEVAQTTITVLDDLLAALPHLPDDRRGWTAWRAVWIFRMLGRPQDGDRMAALSEATAIATDDQKLLGRLRFQQAEQEVLRGELVKAMSFYEHALAIAKELGEEGEESVNLHAMATVHVTRGELDQALDLYHESLAIQERLGDVQGRSATLHEMAYVHVTRGELDQALDLYHESLAIDERLGDVKGRSATLHQMANVHVTRGELDQALDLYHESLAIKERLGDVQGQAFTLGMVGQLRFTQGDPEDGIAAVRRSLALFEQLGARREVAQARKILAQMEGGATPDAPTDLLPADLPPAARAARLVALITATLRGQLPRAALESLAFPAGGAPSAPEAPFYAALRAALDRAPGAARALLDAAAPLLDSGSTAERAEFFNGLRQLADELDDLEGEIAAREAAIALQRQLGDGRETLITLSVMLYNQAMSRQKEGDFTTAVNLLEEVVALDERTGHPDLDADRAALEAARRRVAGDEEDDVSEAALQQLLGALPEAERGRMLVLVQLAPIFGQVATLLHHPNASAAERVRLAQAIEEAATRAADGEAEDSPWLEGAAALRLVAAHLRGRATDTTALASPFREAVEQLIHPGANP